MDHLPTIGWREWVELPEVGDGRIKAKIDTGARSSSLHAFEVNIVERDDGAFVQFRVHPQQRNIDVAWSATARVVDFREIRSSNGVTSVRPVIITPLVLCGVSYPIELTLANRESMGFRMLLGREALRGRFLINPGRSYLSQKHGAKKRKKRRDEH